MITIRASQLNIEETMMLYHCIEKSINILEDEYSCRIASPVSKCRKCKVKKLCDNLYRNKRYLENQILLRWSNEP